MSVPATKVTNFPAMLTAYLPEIQRALPKHLSGDRMSRIALTAFRRNPKLGECEPRSVFAAVIQASQLGLEPDTLGRAFLVPYKGECQFVPGWKGLVDLLNRAGDANAWTGAVFAGDEFDYALGDKPYVKHKPMGESDPVKITHVYAIGRMKGSDYPIIEVWPIARVVKHRDRYNKLGQKHYSYGQWEMYARKVVLLQVLKYLPASAELQQAITLNDAAEIGQQGLTVSDAIEGTWTPAQADDQAAEEVQMPSAKSEKPADVANGVTDGATTATEARTDPGAAVGAGPLKLIRAKLANAGLTETECCKRFGIESLEALTMDGVNGVFAWIANPNG